jgi:hypothetical protein
MRRLVVMSLLLLCCGCGSGPDMAPVSGRITVDGKPVAGLRVSFAPIGSKEHAFPGPGSVGHTDADGRFTLHSLKDKKAGAVIGKCRVRVVSLGSADPNKLPTHDKRIPARFNDATTLVFDVPKGGTDAANFDVSWK